MLTKSKLKLIPNCLCLHLMLQATSKLVSCAQNSKFATNFRRDSVWTRPSKSAECPSTSIGHGIWPVNRTYGMLLEFQ